jgi:hypothetical protein
MTQHRGTGSGAAPSVGVTGQVERIGVGMLGYRSHERLSHARVMTWPPSLLRGEP